MNAVAERITGGPAAEGVGRSVWEVFVREGMPAELARRKPVDIVRERQPDVAFGRQAVCVARDGSTHPIEVHADLTHHADGRTRGIAIIFRDMAGNEAEEMRIRARIAQGQHVPPFRTVRAIKVTPGLDDIPVIAFTAYAMAGDEQRFLAAGCDGYLAKPIEVHSFAASVRRYL